MSNIHTEDKNLKLTIFYDGNCPLCNLEMEKLKRHDSNNAIILVNLHEPNFHYDYPSVSKKDGMKILHGYYRNQKLLGLEVTHRAWTLVGKGIYVAPLDWPILKQLSHQVYLVIAKYRHPISTFIHQRFGFGSTRCNQGTCYGNSNNTNHRRK